MRRFLVGALLIALLVGATAATACGDQKETATTAGLETTVAPSTTAESATTAPPASTEMTAAALKEDVLKVAAITSLTGDMASVFKAMYDAVVPSEEILNDDGGLTVGDTHYSIDIEIYDDQSTTAGALTAMNKLLEDDIKFMLPPMFVPNHLAIAPLANENEVIRVKSLGVSTSEVSAENPYSFFSCCSVYSMAPFYRYVMPKYDLKRVAVLGADDPTGQVFQEKIKSLYEELGIEIAHWEVYPMPSFDFYSILNKAIATNPDAIEILYGIPQCSAALINQARELGYTGPIFGSVGAGDANVINAMLTPEFAYDVVSSGRTYQDFMSPRVKLLKEKVETTGASFEMDSLHLLDAISAMIAVIETAQSFDSAKFVEAVDSGACEGFEGSYGPASWGLMPEIYGNRHAAQPDHLQITTYVNGDLEYELVDGTQ